jgi:hypothetical protein
LANSQIGSSLKAWPLNEFNLESKLTRGGGEEADEATRDFTASIASAYRLSTSKSTLLDLNKDLPGLVSLLKYNRRLRKLGQVIRDPACKTADTSNWGAKTIRRMTHRKAIEWWEAKVGNYEVTPQALWPVGKSLMERDGPTAPAAVHGLLGVTYSQTG